MRLGRHADLGNRRFEVTVYMLEETAVPPKDQLRMSWFCHPQLCGREADPGAALGVRGERKIDDGFHNRGGRAIQKDRKNRRLKKDRALCTLPSFKRTLRVGEAASRAGASLLREDRR